MRINLILIPFVIILGMLLSNNDNAKNRKLYIVLCSIVLILVASLRNPEWMTFRYSIDTLNYKNSFEIYLDISWNELWNRTYQRYFGNGGDFDIGFIALNKVIGLFTHSFYVYSILVDLIFFIPFGIILYRYGTCMRHLIFAFVFYVSLIQIYLLGGARQILAIGFDMIALLAVIDRKKIRAIIFFLLGITIHFSSFLFLVPLLMVWYDAKPATLKRIHILCFVLFPIVLAFPNQIIVLLGEASGVEKYIRYGLREIQGGATTFILLIELLSLFILFSIKQADLRDNPSMRILYVMAPFFTLLAPLIRSNGAMIRISLYYHLFLTLLVSFGIDCMFKGRNRTIVYVVAITGLSLLCLSGGGIEYYFFWQI